MITVNLINRKEFDEYVHKDFAEKPSGKDILLVTEEELINFYKDDDREQWLVIEYYGQMDRFKAEFELLSIKVFLKYYIGIYLPDSASIEDAMKIIHDFCEINMVDMPDSISLMNVKETMPDEYVRLKIFSPRYTYIDLWNKGKKSYV